MLFYSNSLRTIVQFSGSICGSPQDSSAILLDMLFSEKVPPYLKPDLRDVNLSARYAYESLEIMRVTFVHLLYGVSFSPGAS